MFSDQRCSSNEKGGCHRTEGKKGFPDRRNPFLKVLLACWPHLNRGGLPPLFQLLTGFVVHHSRHFPRTVFQPQFAERIARKPGEYQQRKTYYQYAQNNGLVRQFHGFFSCQRKAEVSPSVRNRDVMLWFRECV